ncbi:MAG: Xaa-Pro peptidase family protein [Proteobacteria bacterium]|nr:Xaa-Pro peptidase family protein [Pseudomonadota bacterium]
MSLFEKRIQEFRKKLRLNKIDGFLILHEANRRYLSGYTGHDSGVEESAGALFIFQDAQILATDSRFELQAAQEAPDAEVLCYKTGIHELLPEILSTWPCKKLGFESNRLTYSAYCKIKESINANNLKTEICPADFIVEDLRIIKSQEEMGYIRKALAIAEAAYLKTLNSVRVGIYEKDLAWELEKNMREMGAEGLSFPPIVASGPNSALPHAIPGPRAIINNAPLLFDWGAVFSGYCSDTSRTLSIGQPDDTFKKLYDILYVAQQKAIEAIKPGASTKMIDDIARGHIAKAGYEKKFGHGLGHGVGLEIHESPRLSPLKNSQLEQGMVVTVEPGIYLPDWGGIRLENMVLVTDQGAEVLNTLSYDDYVIER